MNIRFFPALLLVLTIMVSGCADFFSPRDVEDPVGPFPEWWIDPSTPQIALSNFENAYVFRNSPFFNQILLPGFLFYADPLDAEQAQGEFDDWNYDVEVQVTENFFGSDTILISLGLAVPEDTPWPDAEAPMDTTTIYRSYEIGVEDSQHYPPEYPAKGDIVLHFREEEGLWYLEHWKDRRTEDTGIWDWGVIKLDYKSG